MRRTLVVVPLLLLSTAPSAPARAELPPPATPALVFSLTGDGRSEVRWLFPDTGEQRIIASATNQLTADAYDGSNERVYYTQDTYPCPDCHAPRIDSVAAAGGGVSAARASGTDLAISPDGTTWAYTDLGQLVVAPAGKGTTPSGTTGAGGIAPVFSPDSARILFSRSVTPPGSSSTNVDVFVINRDLTGLHRITGAGSDDLAGAWSPDGKRLLITRDAFSDTPSIWALDLDGTHARKVADDASRPSWASDGTIAYVQADARGHRQVVLRSAGVPGVARFVTHLGIGVSSVAFAQRVGPGATSG